MYDCIFEIKIYYKKLCKPETKIDNFLLSSCKKSTVKTVTLSWYGDVDCLNIFFEDKAKNILSNYGENFFKPIKLMYVNFSTYIFILKI